ERQILTVSLYDAMGRRALASGPLAYAPGFRQVNLDVRDLAPGTYHVVVASARSVATRNIIIGR
ncbi:MAG: T9SS type A sorting domain-containing protein, partial [Chlorobi bacterium]|nr:T9SS type A sorting domain-containing protein [Chlorobiota bacterium]